MVARSNRGEASSLNFLRMHGFSSRPHSGHCKESIVDGKSIDGEMVGGLRSFTIRMRWVFYLSLAFNVVQVFLGVSIQIVFRLCLGKKSKSSINCYNAT